MKERQHTHVHPPPTCHLQHNVGLWKAGRPMTDEWWQGQGENNS